jgi:hypothetical protein
VYEAVSLARDNDAACDLLTTGLGGSTFHAGTRDSANRLCDGVRSVELGHFEYRRLARYCEHG